MRSYDLTLAAEEDLQGIWLYTYETWGFDQAETYFNQIEACCEAVGSGQVRSKRLDGLPEGVHIHRCEHHYIAYLDDDRPIIIAILHERDVVARTQVKLLAAEADIIVENFKPGSLDKYGLDYRSMLEAFPHLIYCSISGFGQTGPNAAKPGYDLMAQGYGGTMSLTGAPEGEPMKVGVGVADVMCGMYATVGILAALRHRDQTGEGQHIDIALVDTQVAWLVNEGVNYLTSGKVPDRLGNGHPNIAPYQVFRASDGDVIIAVGNDTQFARFTIWLGIPELAADPRFATNPARLKNRAALIDKLRPLIAVHSVSSVLAGLDARKVPVGPVNSLDQVFASDQVKARDMKIQMPVEGAEERHLDLIGNPLKFSKTPVSYRLAPPKFGQHTREVLEKLSEKSAD